MEEAHEQFIDREFDLHVRETAYFLWEQAGRPWGREQEFWFISLERCLRERQADHLLRNSQPRTVRRNSADGNQAGPDWST